MKDRHETSDQRDQPADSCCADEASPGDARGILKGHFESVEDVNRFIREERDWDEHEADYEQIRRVIARRETEAAMARNINDQTSRTYRAKVTGRHAVTIPAEICRELGIETGDTVEFNVTFGFVSLRPVPKPLPRDESALDEAMGILGGYFESAADVNRFIREGRGEWTEEDEAEYQKSRHLAHDDSSDA